MQGRLTNRVTVASAGLAAFGLEPGPTPPRLRSIYSANLKHTLSGTALDPWRKAPHPQISPRVVCPVHLSLTTPPPPSFPQFLTTPPSFVDSPANLVQSQQQIERFALA
jgi:hypothetical protein